MNRSIAAIASVLVVLTAGSTYAEPHEFTDSFGREIKAEIESVRPPNVSLKRVDGKTFLFPIAKLSEIDQAYVEKWRLENPQIDLDFRFEKAKKSSDGSSENRKEVWTFKVTLSNRAHEDLNDLKIDYTIFKQLNDRYAKDRRRISGKFVGSKTIASVEKQRKVVFETDPIDIGKVNKVIRERGRDYTELTMEKWDEDLVGIAMTVSYRDKVVASEEFGTLHEGDKPIVDLPKGTRKSKIYDNKNTD